MSFLMILCCFLGAHGDTLPTKEIKVGRKVYIVADVNDRAAVYRYNVRKENCFFVISKQEYRLYVYEATDGDTALVAHFPVCYAINTEAKMMEGDMRTPDCDMLQPFYISEIKNASRWKHDFGDGRGSFRAYGRWFMRLDLSQSNNNEEVCANRSIGIHGSTGNAVSVPGRDSEGCIRLRDKDLLTLRNYFAMVGTKVVVKPYEESKYDFEQQAEERLGRRYRRAAPGNPHSSI